MKYISLFSGIEAASVAWKPLGWKPLAFAEYKQDEVCMTIPARIYKGGGEPLIMDPAFSKRPRQQIAVSDSELSYALTTGEPPRVLQPPLVRRLTPTECERLQGFPDGHTKIPYRGKEADKCPKSHRYKALGNSMAVPVIRWLGERILEVAHEGA